MSEHPTYTGPYADDCDLGRLILSREGHVAGPHGEIYAAPEYPAGTVIACVNDRGILLHRKAFASLDKAEDYLVRLRAY